MSFSHRLAAVSDAALIHSDADDAFAEVVRRHGPLVRHVAFRLAGEAAEDVVQQTLLAAWLGRRRFDPARGSLGGWLARIAHNRALDARRAEQRRGHARPLDEAEDVAWPGEAPDAAAARRDASADLHVALRRIPHEQRKALALVFFADLTQSEIHARTRAPLGTVKGRVRLGLHALRRELADGADAARLADAA